jgi:hypothetical protein
MSKALKWILTILAVLVIVAVVAGAVFVAWNHMHFTIRRGAQLPANGTPVPNQPGGQPSPVNPYGYNTYPRFRQHAWGWNMPMMRGGRGFARPGAFGPFGMGLLFFGGLLRLIIPLAVLALVAWLFYRMGKRAGTSAATAAPAAPQKNPAPGRRVAKS